MATYVKAVRGQQRLQNGTLGPLVPVVLRVDGSKGLGLRFGGSKRLDEAPHTLIDVLKHFAVDFVPETRAACDLINTWLAENEDMPSGTQADRSVGLCNFEVDGVEFDTMAQLFRFYVLTRMQDAYDAMSEADQEDVRRLLAAFDMADLLDLKLTRGIGRANNLEVWL